MNKRYFVELTNKLYRLTFFFPEKEPLRYRIRDLGDEILADVVLILEGEIRERRESSFRVEKNIEIIETLLDLAKSQNWIERENVEKIQNYYALIKTEVKEFNETLKREVKRGEMLFPGKSGLTDEDISLIGDEAVEKLRLRDNRDNIEEVFSKEEVKAEKVVMESKKAKKEVKLNKRQEKIIELIKKKKKMQVKDIQEFLPEITKRTLRRDLSTLTDEKIIQRTGKGNTTSYSL